MSIEEAIEGVMKHKGCSRRTARRLIARHMKEGHIDYKLEPQKLEFIDQETAIRMSDEDPENLPISLSELIRVYRFTPDELLGELRAGRLVATPISESVAIRMELQNTFSWHEFTVTSGELADWFANPQTPAQLTDKLQRKLQ